MKKQLKSIISLFSICVAVAVLMAFTNSLTLPIIQKNDDAKANEALLQVLPTGEDFQKVDLTKHELPATVIEAYSEKNGGYVFKLETKGYASGLVIMCGINADGTVSGAICLASNETNKAELTFGDRLKGQSIDSIDEVDTVSSPTAPLTTSAYKNAVKDALNAKTILGGGSVDLRDEAQILNDKLSAALPSAEGKFTSLFIVEDIGQIDAIYTADNGSGAVYVADTRFIGVDKDGNILQELEDDLKPVITSAVAIMAESKLTEIDISTYDSLPSSVTEVYRTDSGNFVLTVKAAGYGISGTWGASGEYIYIKVAISPVGKIINCLTLSQAESTGIGDACADSDFYSQFNGKATSNYTEIDIISGATITSNGYITAIGKALEAGKILNGGAYNEQ